MILYKVKKALDIFCHKFKQRTELHITQKYKRFKGTIEP
jgi:hypothetical protein